MNLKSGELFLASGQKSLSLTLLLIQPVGSQIADFISGLDNFFQGMSNFFCFVCSDPDFSRTRNNALHNSKATLYK
jgi:hypothetical protein